MSSRSSKLMVILTVVLAVSLLMPLAMCQTSDADVRYAQPDDIAVSPSLSSMVVDAGDSKTIYLDIHNKMSYSEEDPNILVVYVYFNNIDDVNVSFPDGNRTEIKGQDIGSCKVVVSVDKYASAVNHKLSFTILINDPDRGSSIRAEASDLVKIEVHSNFSAGDNYNKIMGIWDNPLPEPFNSPLMTTILSFLMWVAIAIIVAYFLLPFLYDVAKKAREKAKEDIDKMEEWGDRRE